MHEVRLLAVSKGQPGAAVRELALAGQRHFGENYVHEALEKMASLADLALCWHFIGRIQSNKTAAIARHFDWVHSVDRIGVLQRLSAQRDTSRTPLKLCLQVNLQAEPTKGGFSPAALPDAVGAAEELPGVALQGLMCLPEPGTGSTAFTALRELAQRSMPKGALLSMGMSADFPEAIAAGAHWVRIGTALFGARSATG